MRFKVYVTNNGPTGFRLVCETDEEKISDFAAKVAGESLISDQVVIYLMDGKVFKIMRHLQKEKAA